jgi:glutamine cyclotransferase
VAARKKSAKKKKGSGSKKRSSAKKAPAKGKKRRKAKSQGNPGAWMVGLGLIGLLVVGALALGQSDGRRAEPEVEVEDVELVDPGASAPLIPVAYDVEVVARHPHDDSAFTQGLLWHEGELYESTGLVGRSSIRRWDLSSGRIAQRKEVDDVFAEGLALVGDELFQLTWQDEVLLVYDRESFELKREIDYEGEGWGLCFDGESLVMSDGSDELTFRDPETFEVRRRLRVRKVGRPVRMLNELECVDGAIWANVWQREEIVKIDPRTGQVAATVDASGLLTFAERRGTDVLNGIAWIPERERFVLTGKLWPAAFEVELVER